jgi:Tol biopolymer transport system component
MLSVSDGSSVELATRSPQAGAPAVTPVGQLAWVPDGSAVAFTSYLLGTADVWLARTDGSGAAARLIVGPGAESNPAYAPDGKRVAFTCDGDAHDTDICLSDGSKLTHLTNDSATDGSPAWSPDGRRLAFASRATCVDPAACLHSALIVARVDGGPSTPLTDGTETDLWPSWSPDGSTIAFVRNDWIWLISGAGNDLRPVRPGVWPTWKP